jgi:uncharacterized protein (TIGR00251 family)
VIADDADGAIVALKIIPRAGRTKLAGVRDNALLVRLAAAPVEGAANAALLAFLSDQLQIPRARLEIVTGEKSRSKRVKVRGMSAATVAARLGLA